VGNTCSMPPPSRRNCGSSPRGWGTQFHHLPLLALVRFIPTRVGNTAHRSITDRRHTVHPHAGGEHCWDSAWAMSPIGSSPRGWGTLKNSTPRHPIIRFIPTRVGNTEKPDNPDAH